ncbi:hemicentin-1-like [Girardinichthys multiradiatus]|uniref:hemicentin-1-like n=1 Tax=Girardinichthys multiradiatus TaxID=208333 RepID=UPI001FAC655C|nr:hemicentin-1-like [Girardinichthys multiradiatus]
MTRWILFVQLFAGLLLNTGGDASCAIDLIPPRVVVKYGDLVSVNCSSSASDFGGIGWEASQGDTGLRETRHVMWTVERLIHWEISPLCFFNNVHDKQCSTRLGLVIYTFPENISISSSNNNNKAMEENVEYNLSCSILNIAPVQNLTIKWYRGDAAIHTEILTNDKKKPTNQTSVFSFKPMRQDHQTTIRCEAHMDLGPEGPQFNASSQELNIDVEFAPDIECYTIEVREGESLDGKCNVTGNPPPNVKWLKDGRPINLTDLLRRDDKGIYEVKAEGLTLVEKKIQVNVLYGPERMCPDTYTAPEHTSHNLTCSQGFPKPQEIWYKDDEEVKLPDILTRRDAGQYWVTVSNNLTTLNFTVDIVVHYPPSDILELENSEVQVGGVFGLKCSSVGNPRPNYSWIYYKTHNVNERTEDGVSGLIINDATGFNTGSYTCQAWNGRGNVSKTVRVTVKGAKPECPIEIEPDTMVLKYQSRGWSAVCKPQTNESNVKEIFWKTREDRRIFNRTWNPDIHENWDLSPVCHGEFLGIGRCNKTLHYILYKPPETVSIDIVNNSESTVEGAEMKLQCSIINVTPAEHLRVRWMWQRGNETIEPALVGVNNESGCSFPTRRSPVNVVCTMNITLNRTHDGIQVQCEAELNLGPKGPQPPPSMTSNSFNLSVQYEPRINTTKLPKLVPVIRGYTEELFCEADGNPPPRIQWHYSSGTASLGLNGTLVVKEEGIYNCTAENDLNTDKRVVQVILKEDYLPLIAGFVALTVVIISIIFVFIYSIYYKNTKMRRYSLKNPKLSSHNGNVAHNGWDIQLPVTKLS